LSETVSIEPFDPTAADGGCYLSTIKIEVGFLRKALEMKDEFDTAEMAKAFQSVRP
jgi:vesicle-fusing ATPase